MKIHGLFLDGKTSKGLPAVLEVLSGTEQISICVDYEAGHSEYITDTFSACKVESKLAGTPREIVLSDGQLFITDDSDAVDQLVNQHRSNSRSDILHRLETSFPMIVGATALTVLFLWGMVVYGFPRAATFIAFNMPEFASSKLGGSLDVLDKTMFEPTTLADDRRTQIMALMRPYMDDYAELNPQLHFRSGMQANAFALPNGDIVFTDDFVNLVKSDEELIAVFFHELGHLKHKHMTRRILQDTMLTLMVVFITGDLETLDLLVGLPTLVADLAYSRDFEREADEFALDTLHRYGFEVDVFASAMQRLSDYYSDGSDEESHDYSVPDFLSTHPGVEERIEKVKAYKYERNVD